MCSAAGLFLLADSLSLCFDFLLLVACVNWTVSAPRAFPPSVC